MTMARSNARRRDSSKTRALRVAGSTEVCELLRTLGLFTDVSEGRLSCDECTEPLRLESVFAVYPDGGSAHVVCDQAECIRAFALRAQQLGLQ